MRSISTFISAVVLSRVRLKQVVSSSQLKRLRRPKQRHQHQRERETEGEKERETGEGRDIGRQRGGETRVT